MKRIRALRNSTPGLAIYLAGGGSPSNWERFRSDDREAYRELRDALAELQHNLCGYCEIDLIENDIQVEHIIPQSDPRQGRRRALDYANLIAACRGGTERMFDSNGLGDARRFQHRVSDNTSCGAAKGNVNDADFIDPRNLPALPSLLVVRPDGVIVADEVACAETGFAVNRVQNTVAILGLNVERLRQERESLWNKLTQDWDGFALDDEIMLEAARGALLPDADGKLPSFFTTARSYFGPLAESILAEPPQSWL